MEEITENKIHANLSEEEFSVKLRILSKANEESYKLLEDTEFLKALKEKLETV